MYKLLIDGCPVFQLSNDYKIMHVNFIRSILYFDALPNGISNVFGTGDYDK